MLHSHRSQCIHYGDTYVVVVSPQSLLCNVEPNWQKRMFWDCFCSLLIPYVWLKTYCCSWFTHKLNNMQHHILILMAVIGDPEWPDGKQNNFSNLYYTIREIPMWLCRCGFIPTPGLTFPHEAAYTKESSPLWLSTALTSNENYAHRHGHGIDIEFRKGPDFFDFQNKWCDRLPKQSKDRWNCYNSAHRENCEHTPSVVLRKAVNCVQPNCICSSKWYCVQFCYIDS